MTKHVNLRFGAAAAAAAAIFAVATAPSAAR